MKGKLALCVLFGVLTALMTAACGDDETAPGDVSAVIPDAVFFNITGGDEVVLFSGRATDNRMVESVLISFNNGSDWNTAQIDPDPSVRDVLWSYYATSADMPSISTVLIRAADPDGNETTSPSYSVRKDSGSSPADLAAFFFDAAAQEVLALSSGEGDAFGGIATPFAVPSDVTIIGAGYGNAATSGGVTPSAASTATVLQAPFSTAAIFGVSGNLDIRGMRLVGATDAISVGGADASVRVEDCLFDGQDAWAVQAVGGAWEVEITILSSIVDASVSGDATGGGLYLEDVDYEVSGSEFYLENGVAEGGAIQVVGGSGTITGCLFEENYLAIWASGGSLEVTSCEIQGGSASDSYGIELTGGPGTAEIQRNTINGNTGYGLYVGGEMELYLRRNAITNNELSGILIDSALPNGDLVNINMGVVGDEGRNLLDNNSHPSGVAGYETQVFVTAATSEGGQTIPANWNYWGYIIINEINLSIIDNGDNGGGRATIAVGNFYTSTSEVGP